jgi:hypothetical protein
MVGVLAAIGAGLASGALRCPRGSCTGLPLPLGKREHDALRELQDESSTKRTARGHGKANLAIRLCSDTTTDTFYLPSDHVGSVDAPRRRKAPVSASSALFAQCTRASSAAIAIRIEMAKFSSDCASWMTAPRNDARSIDRWAPQLALTLAATHRPGIDHES